MAEFIRLLTGALTIVILVDVLISFFLPPYHAVRRTLDAVVNPLLAPIRKVVPPVGTLDFSPVILLVIVQLLGAILIQVAG